VPAARPGSIATQIRLWTRLLAGWLRLAGAAGLGRRDHTESSPACVAQAFLARPGVAVVTCL